jgi:hypothetical protein
MSATLYEISADLQALEMLLTEVGGELPDAVAEAAIDAWLEETGKATRDKVDDYCGLIRELEARRDARKAEARRLADRAQIDANTVDRLKGRLLSFFEVHAIKTMETARFRVTAAQNGGVVPLIITAPLESIPDEFIEFVRKPMNPMIREMLEAGEALPFAELGERGKSIRIK